jgi:hypothetical protein
MLEMYDFTVTQVRYIKAAMDQIASFRPDGLSPVDVAALTPNPDPIRANYVTKLTAAGVARDARNNGATAVHDLGVLFLSQARSTYRKNPSVLEQLDRIMTKDQTFTNCMTRGDQTSAVWGTLPNVGTPPAPFKVLRDGTLVPKADLDTLIANARAADVALPGLDQLFQKAEGDLHVKHHELDDFVSAALNLGRSAYSEGTAERDMIDAIPSVPATHEPDKAVIASLVFDGGQVTITYDALHATTYKIFVKLPGASDFTQVAEDRIEKTFSLPLDTHGDWEFKVVGHNSRGDGPESDVATGNG